MTLRFGNIHPKLIEKHTIRNCMSNLTCRLLFIMQSFSIQSRRQKLRLLTNLKVPMSLTTTTFEGARKLNSSFQTYLGLSGINQTMILKHSCFLHEILPLKSHCLNIPSKTIKPLQKILLSLRFMNRSNLTMTQLLSRIIKTKTRNLFYQLNSHKQKKSIHETSERFY